MAEENGTMVALVTGANKGIGREISRQLGKQGMTVLIGARDEARGTEAANELRGEGMDARFLLIDVTDEATVEAARDQTENEFGRLDVLVNNAGVGGGPWQASAYDAQTMRHNYETNVFGVVTVTRVLLPLLRRSSSARVVNMSSPLGSLALMSDPEHPVAGVGLLAYNSSKTALNAVTVMYANELRGTGILVNSANPGFVATDLNDHQGELTVEEGARTPVRLATLPEGGPTGKFFGEDGEVPW